MGRVSSFLPPLENSSPKFFAESGIRIFPPTFLRVHLTGEVEHKNLQVQAETLLELLSTVPVASQQGNLCL